MTLDQFRTWIAPISQTIAVIVVIGGLVIWGINLQNKVEGVEGQLRELKAVMAASAQQNFNSTSSPCANLSDRFASALALHTRSGDSDTTSIRGLMTDLGCMNTPKK